MAKEYVSRPSLEVGHDDEPDGQDVLFYFEDLGDFDPDLIVGVEESVSTASVDADDLFAEWKTSKTTFGEWWEAAVTHEEINHETQQHSPNLPEAFTWAEQEAERASGVLSQVTLGGLSAVGQTLSSLGSLIGSCGLVCTHGLGALAQAGTASFSGLSGVSGGGPGISFGSDGRMNVSGTLSDISRASGLSESGLLSGAYSAQEILAAIMDGMGGWTNVMFGFEIFTTILDSLIPTRKAA